MAQRERKAGRLGVHSRTIDRGAVGDFIRINSREGKFLRHYEAMLVQHVGGKPSIVQRTLISRAARIALHLELMDQRTLADGHLPTLVDSNYYVSWSNALARLLARLGIETPKPNTPTLAEYLTQKRARAEEAAE
jgi:hypothetical protein